jgi:hypothetical protein
MDMLGTISWLQSYLAENSDGDWEHQYGIEITSTDNPGWHVRIDIIGTRFEELLFSGINEKRTSEDWIILSKEEGAVVGSGGPHNLVEILTRLHDALK